MYTDNEKLKQVALPYAKLHVGQLAAKPPNNQWYYNLADSEPIGPFETREAAIADARDPTRSQLPNVIEWSTFLQEIAREAAMRAIAMEKCNPMQERFNYLAATLSRLSGEFAT